MKQVVACACCVLVVVLSGCKRGPVLKKEDDKIQIVEVTISQEKNLAGTVNFPEAVRVATQNAAYKFSEEGPQYSLRVHLRVLKISSFGRALTTSGSSSIRMSGYLTNKVSGKRVKKFKAIALIRRMGGLIGAMATIGVDPVKDEQVLAKKLGTEIMRRIYGDEYTASVAAREPTKRITPNYPMSWEDAGKKFQCEQTEADNKDAPKEMSQSEYQPFTPQELPAYCGKYLKSGS